MCTALVCGAQCSMPARLGHWRSRTFSVCSEMTGQWSDRSAMSGCKTLSQWATCVAWHWGSGPHSEGEKTSMVWTCGTLQWCNQDSLWQLGWWKAWAWEAQNDMEAADREGLQRVEADVPGDLVWDLPCVQQASYLEGGPLMWMLPLYLHVNQKSDYDDDDFYTPRKLCLCGGRDILFSRCPSIHVSIHLPCWFFPNILKMQWWIFFSFCRHIDIKKMYLHKRI